MVANSPIIFFGPDSGPGEEAAAIGAADELRKKLFPILEQFGPTAMMNALISVYLDLVLATQGFVAADESLRMLRRELPRIAAAQRASRDKPAGNA